MHWRATACHLNLHVTWWLNLPSESCSQALSKWFHFRMPLCGMSICAHVCVHAVWCVTACRDFCPSLWPAFCGTAGRMGVLESFRISGKINGRIKLNVIWIAMKGRIVWQADLLVTFSHRLQIPFLSLKKKKHFNHVLLKSRYRSYTSSQRLSLPLHQKRVVLHLEATFQQSLAVALIKRTWTS